MFSEGTERSRISSNYDEVIKLLQFADYQFTPVLLQESMQAGREWCRHFAYGIDTIELTPHTREIARQYLLGDRANYRGYVLYKNEEIQQRLHEVTKSTVTTVRFPMSYFSSQPTAFRRAFWKEWMTNHIAHQDAKAKKKTFNARPLREWDSMKLLDLPGAEALFTYNKDVLTYGSARNTHDVAVPTVDVQLPRIGFPKMLAGKEVAAASVGGTMIRSIWRFARRTGYARHEIDLSLIQASRPLKGRIVRWTPGLLIGQEAHHPDYLIGATSIMLATRAKEILGADFGANWMMTEADIVDAEKATWLKWYTRASDRLQQELPEAREYKLQNLTYFMR